MRYTIGAGRYFGIPVRIHFTFPLILIVFGVEAWLRGGWGNALHAVALTSAVFVCVVLHEFGHSLQVLRYGIAVRDIVLLPIGGMARMERIPENPWQEIVVAISGPLVNFALAALLFGVLMATGFVVVAATEGPTTFLDHDRIRLPITGLFVGALVAHAISLQLVLRGADVRSTDDAAGRSRG